MENLNFGEIDSTKINLNKFYDTWEKILSELHKDEEYKDIRESMDWIHKLMKETVPFGKFTRGLTLIICFKSFMGRPITSDEEEKAMILAWCLEIMQTSCLIADDIMDNSETRRGKPCWYKNKDVGLSAVNDAFILESIFYKIIRKYFNQTPYLLPIILTFQDVVFKTTLGQSLDTRLPMTKDVDEYNWNLYEAIVKYKTSYYSFCLPVKLALILSGVNNVDASIQAEKILLDIGYLFQVQDDYLDCYGDPNITGKIGTDIQERKCSWLIIRAFELANPKQKRLLTKYYGKSDKDVKSIYMELKMSNEFKAFENMKYENIVNSINVLPSILNPKPFLYILHKVYERKK